MREWMLSAVMGMALGVVACGGGSGGGSSGGTELTLDTCTTTVGAGVPDFYKTYFKCSDLSVSGGNVVITTKGLPPHKSYYYGKSSPNYADFDYSRGSLYKPNPNVIASTTVTVQIPMSPTPRANLSITPGLIDGQVNNSLEYKLGTAGVALDGVSLFNPLAKPGDDIENEKYTFDDYNAHPENRGVYHYHVASPGPLEVLVKLGKASRTDPGAAEVELYGIMCDGTVVLGCTELDATEPDKSDFDAQNGHVHDLKDTNGTVLFANRYHTHLCSGWTDKPRPYTPEIQYYQACTVQ